LYRRAREFASEDVEDYVCFLVLRDLSALYLSQSILDISLKDMWIAKVHVLVGRDAASDRQSKFADLISGAAKQMLLESYNIPQPTDDETIRVSGEDGIERSAAWWERELWSLVGEVCTGQLLQKISEIVKRLAEAASHGVAGSEIAAYRNLSLAVGHLRKRSIWNPPSGI
jgi:hypothetical protein